SIGTGDSRAAAPAPMLKALGMVLAGKEKAERHLIDSGLSFTIIRPGVLLDKPANGRGVLIQDTSASGVISRAELASVTIAAIGDEQTVGRIYTAIEKR
ncbi:MAG: NAD(P)H-binding protein, partial [Gammaproteobacteria bacterium]